MDADPMLRSGDSRQEADYWSFEGRAKRRFAHGFLQYPAMMVPQMQGELIDLINEISPGIEHIWDPFVGAGTILSEAMIRGLDFSGNDINPLAVLVSKTKRGPFHLQAATIKANELYARINADKSIRVDIDFPGLEKWFSAATTIALSRIRRAIKGETALWARRFFWVAMAECVRLTSNSRTSTYKLHLRPESDLIKLRDDATVIFQKILNKNLYSLGEFKEHLNQKSLLKNNHYIGHTSISLADTSHLPKNFLRKSQIDLVITSPPYGDNRSTVPYGQYSYLPLNWIDLSDIDLNINKGLIRSTNSIDSASLGGAINSHASKVSALTEKYAAFNALITQLASHPDYAQKKVTSFFFDLDKCLDQIVDRLKPGGFMVWTVGNRTVSNQRIPMDTIYKQMANHRGLHLVEKFERSIPSKRMPAKNSVSNTMKHEHIVIHQRLS